MNQYNIFLIIISIFHIFSLGIIFVQNSKKSTYKEEKKNKNEINDNNKKKKQEEDNINKSLIIETKINQLEELRKEIKKEFVVKKWDNEDEFEKKITKIKNHLIILFEKEINEEIKKIEDEKINELNNRIKERTTKIICLSMEKYSSQVVISKTINIIKIENKEVVSRIIGKNGRNINLFKKITGTELIINNDNDSDFFVQISSFNTLKRKIATKTLEISIKNEEFSPNQIENNYKKAEIEISSNIIKTGREIIKELEIDNVHEELIRKIGILEYRMSFGQNVLEHSIEVAKMSGSIAEELNLDKKIATRAGLFHDIGKATENEEDSGSHVENGINIAKKCNENSIIINAIASHHKEEAANNFYSLIVIAADKLSAARPGSRGYQLENYIERMKKIEDISKEIPGIKQCYAFQSGREIWIIIDPEKISEYKMWKLSNLIKKKIKDKIIIPGNKVNINILREKKITYSISLNEHDSNDKDN